MSEPERIKQVTAGFFDNFVKRSRLPAMRTTEYMGRRFITHERVAEFSGQRVARLSAQEVELANRHPITAALLPCCAGYFPRARGHEIRRPQGDWRFLLLLCSEGSGRVRSAGGELTLTTGSFVLLRPFEPHAYLATPRNPWSLYWVHFNGLMASDYYDELTKSGTQTCRSIKMDVQLVGSFEQIINVYAEGFADSTLIRASACLHQLLSTLIRACDRGAVGCEDIGQRIRRTIEVMQVNLSSHISMREFAAAAHVSANHFAAKFRETTGESPQQYFIRLKIQRARELLQNTSHKVEHVAQAVGFSDAFYFSKAFKKLVGVSPSQFRATCGKCRESCSSGAANDPL